MIHGQLKEHLTRKDLVSSSEVRWCPGCGNYAILNAVQTALPQLGLLKEDIVFVSGIGCSSRFPYYMDTYGFHSIHGRAPAIATGVKVANPDLSVWVITGDGDGLSIGGNHMIHALRRNLDLNIILFNNRIYGLTKGQYSPTTERGFITKTSPYGVIDEPIKPLIIALASEATFIARTLDTNPQHMAMIMKAACEHKGASFVETFQNCVIFNKGTWNNVAERSVRDDRLLFLQHGKPLIFGAKRNKGIVLKRGKFRVVTIGEHGVKEKDLVVHDDCKEDPTYAFMLANMHYPEFPVPVGILRQIEKPIYEQELANEIKRATALYGRRNLQRLLRGTEYWTVKESGKIIENTSNASDKARDEARIMSERLREEGHKASDILTASLKTPVGEIYYRHDGYKRSVCMSPRDSIGKAIAYFKANRVECILVSVKDRIYGLLTERDIIQNVLLSNVGRDRTPVSTIMRPVYEIIDESNTVGDVINVLSISGHRHVPMRLESGEYGLVTIRQILQFIYETNQQITLPDQESQTTEPAIGDSAATTEETRPEPTVKKKGRSVTREKKNRTGRTKTKAKAKAKSKPKAKSRQKKSKSSRK